MLYEKEHKHELHSDLKAESSRSFLSNQKLLFCFFLYMILPLAVLLIHPF